MKQPSSSRLMISLALVASIGCAADSLTLPSEGEPALVEILNGDGQNGVVGQPLTDSLLVRVSDGHDRPVVNQVVSFVITVGGVVTPASVSTDDQGRAQFTWQLGTASGNQVLEVGVSASGGLVPKASFNAMADPGPAVRIALVRGDGQTAQAGHALGDSLVVRLEDAYGNPVGGKSVVWSTSFGSLSDGSVTTGANGEAAVLWTLGTAVGTQTATARFGTVTNSPIQFSATATQGPPPQLAMLTQPSPDAVSGEVFAIQPAVRLQDDLGNPIALAGVQVTAAVASGGGTLLGTTTVGTNGSGIAQFTDLRITGAAGTRTLIFAAPGHTATSSDPIDITATSPGATSTVEATPTTVAAGEIVTVTVTARDAGGAPIPGQPVTISVTGSSNTINQPAGPTDANGVATATFSSAKAETKTVTARVNGQSLAQAVPVTVTAGPPAASQTTASVPDGSPLQFTTITIFTEDAFGNPLTSGGYASAFSVSVTGANRSTPNVNDRGDGTYTASYFALFRGNDDISITLNGVPIKGSPYRSKVK